MTSNEVNRRAFLSAVVQVAAVTVLEMEPGIRALADEAPSEAREPHLSSMLIGNYLRGAPCGIAWIVADSAAFVLDTGFPYVAGTAAADSSYHAYRFVRDGAEIMFQWGRVGDNAVARLSSDRPMDLQLSLSSGWPGWVSTFEMMQDGANGRAQSAVGLLEWTLRISPGAESVGPSTMAVTLIPGTAVRLIAGLSGSTFPAFESIDGILDEARGRYRATRAKAEGDLLDFVGAITDNMNNSRLYANDNHRLAHSVCRDWSSEPNGSPYFCWDSFLTANLAAIGDPVVARNTVRAMLSYQSTEGLVPNYAHWNDGISNDRSQPPVASLCIWKMHQRYPDDREFLEEIYSRLVKWHDWWPQYRNNKRDGLLEWGSSTGEFQAAQYETGWDDNLHYAGVSMRGTTMDAYSIDLSSMWSMDAHYLALIAGFLGHRGDAVRFHREHAEMNRRIDDRLWNSEIGCYCSRFWNDIGFHQGGFLTRLTPMNFYPLAAGVPDRERAKRVLQVLMDPGKFWGNISCLPWHMTIPTITNRSIGAAMYGGLRTILSGKASGNTHHPRKSPSLRDEMSIFS